LDWVGEFADEGVRTTQNKRRGMDARASLIPSISSVSGSRG
jgi:hypothetical protein